MATRAGKMKLSCPLGTTCVSYKKLESHVINPLLTKLVRSRCLDIGLLPFLRVYNQYIIPLPDRRLIWAWCIREAGSNLLSRHENKTGIRARWLVEFRAWSRGPLTWVSGLSKQEGRGRSCGSARELAPTRKIAREISPASQWSRAQAVNLVSKKVILFSSYLSSAACVLSICAFFLKHQHLILFGQRFETSSRIAR